MSVTDLTGTTWQFKQELDIYYFSSSQLWNINFINNNNNYTMLSIDETWSDFGLAYVESLGQYIDVYDFVDGWYNNNYDIYKTITISGGTDATNTDLILWLQTNATQVLPIRPDFYKVTDLELTSLADAIRSAGATGSLTFPDGFISGIENAGGYCNISVDDYINRTYTSVEAGVSKIRPGTFYSHSSLTTVSFPNCISIGSSAFYYCSSLATISFPNCTSIGAYAFFSCRSLTTVSFPNCTSIGSFAFQYCNNPQFTTALFPRCTSIGASAFFNCPSLTTVSFPECEYIGTGAFYYADRLTSLYFPKCTSIGTYAFQYCSMSLTNASFPSCTSIGNTAFAGCTLLTTVSLPKCLTINNSAFKQCYNLLSLYLNEVSSVTTLVNSNAFTSTPIAGYTTSTGGVYGSIYVPSSLLTSFKTATNWTYFSDRMVGV